MLPLAVNYCQCCRFQHHRHTSSSLPCCKQGIRIRRRCLLGLYVCATLGTVEVKQSLQLFFWQPGAYRAGPYLYIYIGVCNVGLSCPRAANLFLLICIPCGHAASSCTVPLGRMLIEKIQNRQDARPKDRLKEALLPGRLDCCHLAARFCTMLSFCR